MPRDPDKEPRGRNDLLTHQSSKQSPRRAFLLVVTSLLLIYSMAATASENEVHRVLVIYQDSSVLKSSIEIANGISQGLRSVPTGRLDLYTEFLDVQRFSAHADLQKISEHFGSKYKNLRIDILVPIGPEAVRFVLNSRAHIAPAAKVIFGDISDRTYTRLAPPNDVAGIVTPYDIKKTVDLAIGLQDDAVNVVVFSGSAEFDKYWEDSARLALGDHYRHLPVTYISSLPLSGFAARARQLDRSTILLVLTIFEDSVGRKYRPREAVLEIAKASGAPIYGLLSSYVGSGIVGGHVATYESIGTDVAALIIKAAQGETTNVIHAASQTVADWQQMQRWQLSKADLPAASQLINFRLGIWDEYRWQIIAVALLLLTEALAIMALFVERRNRYSAEGQARSRLLELVHLNQSATAGALSASIAHELNQPLGAILSNAEAAEAILSGKTPDLNIIRQILADIRDDDQRAGDIILRLRGLLKKRNTIDWQEFDLNEVVESAINILHAEAEKRRVTVIVEKPVRRLPVKADRVHLQQVILNLAINAMDAMTDTASVDRKLTFQAGLQDDAQVELSISDTGRGIPNDGLDSIFEAFYTTKSNGTGLGLAIARAIVETYGGKIWADNRAGGGAVFRFVLPLAGAA